MALTLACAAAGADSTPAFAVQQETGRSRATQYDDFDELNLEDLLNAQISIASGRAQALEQAPGIVSVITDEEIQDLGARTLEEVLEAVPGFEVLTDSSGVNQIAVRGVVTSGGSENVLLMFNGHRIGDQPTTINLRMPVDNIERIEVIRGPGSALFGTGAFLGVINIIPKTADDFEGIRLSAGAGSFATQQYNLLGGHRAESANLSYFLQYATTDGPSLPVPRDEQSRRDDLIAMFLPGYPRASLAPGETRGDYESLDFNFQSAFRGFVLQGRYKDEESAGFIGTTDTLSDRTLLEIRQALFDVSYRHSLFGGEILGRFYLTDDTLRQVRQPFPPRTTIPGFALGVPEAGVVTFPEGILFDLKGSFRTYRGDVTIDYPLFAGNDLTFGAVFEHAFVREIESLGNVDPETLETYPTLQPIPDFLPEDYFRDVASAFVQDTWDLRPQIGLTAGVRYDHYSDVGETVNPRAALVWRLPREFNLKVLYGEAYRAPTAQELSRDLFNLFGVPDLGPSDVRSFEIAVARRFRRNIRVSANYFANFIRDFIVPSGAGHRNSEGADVHGVEVEAKWAYGDNLSAFLNYTYQHTEDLETGEPLPYTPAHLANLSVPIPIGRHLIVAPSVIARGPRPRFPDDEREEVPGYALVNLSLRAVRLSPSWEAWLSVNNLFDTEYTDPSPVLPYDYPRPGINFLITVAYRFQP